jgi:hypothetical protein
MVAILSAICWIRAAALGAPVLETFFDGPPEPVADRLMAQWRWNTVNGLRGTMNPAGRGMIFMPGEDRPTRCW